MDMIIAWWLIGYIITASVTSRMYDDTFDDKWLFPHWSVVFVMSTVWPLLLLYIIGDIINDSCNKGQLNNLKDTEELSEKSSIN